MKKKIFISVSIILFLLVGCTTKNYSKKIKILEDKIISLELKINELESIIGDPDSLNKETNDGKWPSYVFDSNGNYITFFNLKEKLLKKYLYNYDYLVQQFPKDNNFSFYLPEKYKEKLLTIDFNDFTARPFMLYREYRHYEHYIQYNTISELT